MRFHFVFFLVATLLLGTPAARAQRFSAGTDAVDWLCFGTLNAEVSAAVSQHCSLHAGAALNPWTFRAGDPEKQFQFRQNSYWGGARWWPWHVYSGWWFGGDLRYTVYNVGGITKRLTEEGDAWGAGAYGGYSVMLNEHLNLDLGAGFRGGYKKYRQYGCPVCGPIVDEGEKAFFLPDARIALLFIF